MICCSWNTVGREQISERISRRDNEPPKREGDPNYFSGRSNVDGGDLWTRPSMAGIGSWRGVGKLVSGLRHISGLLHSRRDLPTGFSSRSSLLPSPLAWTVSNLQINYSIYSITSSPPQRTNTHAHLTAVTRLHPPPVLTQSASYILVI